VPATRIGNKGDPGLTIGPIAAPAPRKARHDELSALHKLESARVDSEPLSRRIVPLGTPLWAITGGDSAVEELSEQARQMGEDWAARQDSGGGRLQAPSMISDEQW